jgi:Tfp pilus assembly protein PilX
MKSFINQAKNEEGFVLVIALLILVFLTIIGISATTTTQIELQISGNEKSYRIALPTWEAAAHSTERLWITICMILTTTYSLPLVASM